MKTVKASSILSCMLIFVFVLSACGALAPGPTVTPTDTPAPTATITLTPTSTPEPSPTPKPTKTPNLAATQRYNVLFAEAQDYFDKGYITTTDGIFKRLPNFKEEWAQLSWYQRHPLDYKVENFYISAHIKWSSAYRNAEISGCGIAFATQENDDHYAVFLDRSRVYFVETEYYYRPIGPTRGTGRVSFGNPADSPVETDFTLIVTDAYAYVLVDGELVGEYTLAQSKKMNGWLAYAILSGTNKDYGTRCEMTDVRLFIPD